MFMDKCKFCGQELGYGQYMCDLYGAKAHMGHDHMCFSCHRFVSSNDSRLPDGRWVCSQCLKVEVAEQKHIDWVYSRVLQCFSQHGITDLPKGIKIALVPYSKLCQLSGLPKGAIGHQYGVTVTTQSFFSQSHKVYLLDHLHRINAAGVLAHELLHVWQNERHITLPPQLCEGFCNLGSYIVYQMIGNEMSQVLVRYLKDSPDPIYGDGFRIALAIYEHVGDGDLRKVMKEIRK